MKKHKDENGVTHVALSNVQMPNSLLLCETPNYIDATSAFAKLGGKGGRSFITCLWCLTCISAIH